MKPRILSISYDQSLLLTRDVMLKQAGYDVVSTEGFAEAIEHCWGEFDLIIMGHSIPQKDKRAIVLELRARGCGAPLLSLIRPGEQPIQEAVDVVDPFSPERLLEKVGVMLGGPQRAQV